MYSIVLVYPTWPLRRSVQQIEEVQMVEDRNQLPEKRLHLLCNHFRLGVFLFTAAAVVTLCGINLTIRIVYSILQVAQKVIHLPILIQRTPLHFHPVPFLQRFLVTFSHNLKIGDRFHPVFVQQRISRLILFQYLLFVIKRLLI